MGFCCSSASPFHAMQSKPSRGGKIVGHSADISFSSRRHITLPRSAGMMLPAVSSCRNGEAFREFQGRVAPLGIGALASRAHAW